jgi:hypothetical protein
MTKNYEAPEVLELGDARELTLGQNGTGNDNCACHWKSEEPVA